MSATATGAVRVFAFTATQSVTFMVAARDHTEAEEIAERYAGDALDGAAPYVDVDGEGEVTEDSWHMKHHGDDLPYCDPGLNPNDLTVKELMEEQAANPPPNESRGPVLWCEACLHERVQFDWREARQLCADCRTAEDA